MKCILEDTEQIFSYQISYVLLKIFPSWHMPLGFMNTLKTDLPWKEDKL
jgi:hypothetical protein